MGFITNLITNINSFRQKTGEKLIYLDTKIGNLSELNTPNKESIVKAINSKEGTTYGTNTLPELKTGIDITGKFQTAKNVNDYVKYEIANKPNWDSAYSWGNHALVGYVNSNNTNLVQSDFDLHLENGAFFSMHDNGIKVSKGGIYSIYGSESIKSYNQDIGATYQFQEILFPKRMVQNTEERVYPITYINGVKANDNGRIDISSFNINWSGIHTFSQTLTALSFYEGSLRKFKYNIKPFEKSALDIINSLEIVTYDRKDIDLKNKIGVIADDSPNEILSESKEAVDLYKTIFVLAKAVQELSNKIK